MSIQTAARLMQMTAVAESTTHTVLKLPAYLREKLSHKLRISRQLGAIEPGGVSQKATGWQIVQFHVTRGVTSALQLPRDSRGAELQLRNQGVEKAALAHATRTAQHCHPTTQAIS